MAISNPLMQNADPVFIQTAKLSQFLLTAVDICDDDITSLNAF
jgi:hypothetical protein